ncbi:hypothetical protein WN50_13060 [Limnoraphis robusta CS-951]|uniref:Uncharacterized protein n=1 Tax=Limnoraphis robusta CS-951 TaxID=1637645 RepID=A0A0F5YFM5_9CYAN|nr:hypothetical protein WN50_13060 [Limnoraphis robusta CS-951]
MTTAFSLSPSVRFSLINPISQDYKTKRTPVTQKKPKIENSFTPKQLSKLLTILNQTKHFVSFY